MGEKKPDSKDTSSAATAASSGRISGLKVSRDSCEFKLKGGKGAARQFAVNGKSGLAHEIAAKVLVAAWEGKHKITVQSMTEPGMENLVASISLGSLRKEPKPAKAEKSEKDEKPAKSGKASKAARADKPAKPAKPVTVTLEEPLAA
jgi:hypothetical protein